MHAAATSTRRLAGLHIRHVTGGIDAPRLNGVVVIDRSRAPDGAQLADRRLHVAGFVDDARLQQRGAARPRPVDAKARQRLRQDRALQLRGAPVAAAVGRHVDTAHLAATRPREAANLVIAAIEQYLSAGRRRDDALRLLDPRVLPLDAAGHQVDVVQRLLARVPRRVAHFEPPQPLDARHALHAGNQQAQRIALLGAQHLAVLAVNDENVIERHLERDRPRQRRAVGTLGQYEAGALAIHTRLVEQYG